VSEPCCWLQTQGGANGDSRPVALCNRHLVATRFDGRAQLASDAAIAAGATIKHPHKPAMLVRLYLVSVMAFKRVTSSLTHSRSLPVCCPSARITQIDCSMMPQ
jgi:hypothetical protein